VSLDMVVTGPGYSLDALRRQKVAALTGALHDGAAILFGLLPPGSASPRPPPVIPGLAPGVSRAWQERATVEGSGATLVRGDGFAVCVENREYPVSLQQWKIYRVLPDPDAARHDEVRVIDESGEDYLFPSTDFRFVEFARRPSRR